jgi:hypothetical protein
VTLVIVTLVIMTRMAVAVDLKVEPEEQWRSTLDLLASQADWEVFLQDWGGVPGLLPQGKEVGGA